MTKKWWISNKQYIHDNTQTPKITSFIITPSLLCPYINYFWCHKFCRAHRRQ